MQELRCPHCGEVFQVDETGYAQLARQVRDSEFDKELRRREQELLARQESELDLVRLRQEQAYQKTLRDKDEAIAQSAREAERLRERLGRKSSPWPRPCSARRRRCPRGRSAF